MFFLFSLWECFMWWGDSQSVGYPYSFMLLFIFLFLQIIPPTKTALDLRQEKMTALRILLERYICRWDLLVAFQSLRDHLFTLKVKLFFLIIHSNVHICSLDYWGHLGTFGKPVVFRFVLFFFGNRYLPIHLNISLPFLTLWMLFSKSNFKIQNELPST